MKRNDLSMIGALPLPSTWLQYIGAYQSDDARIVRASLSMLFAAFHGQPCGSLENSLPSIASAAQLPLDVAQEFLPLLKAGYRETRTRLIFDPMVEMATRFHERHSAQLQELHDRAVLQLSSPTLFDADGAISENELSAVGGATRAKAKNNLDRQSKVVQSLPYGSEMTEAMKNHCERKGFDVSQYQDIWEKFSDYAHSSRRKYADWNAAFRTWMNNGIEWGKLYPMNQHHQAQSSMSVAPIRPAFAPMNAASQRKENAKEISRQRLMKTEAFMTGDRS